MTEAIVPSPKLDLTAAADLKTELRKHQEQDVVLDMSDVTHLGALCMQVLISAAKTAREENRSLSMTNISDRVLEQMRVMGMTPEKIAGGVQ